MPQGDGHLYDADTKESTGNGNRKMAHTQGFKFLDREALITSMDFNNEKQNDRNPWRLCPISQVEEVKCILRLLPIWLCTIIYSVVFTQMASFFVEQGVSMTTTVFNFRIPAASMSKEEKPHRASKDGYMTCDSSYRHGLSRLNGVAR